MMKVIHIERCEFIYNINHLKNILFITSLFKDKANFENKNITIFNWFFKTISNRPLKYRYWFFFLAAFCLFMFLQN